MHEALMRNSVLVEEQAGPLRAEFRFDVRAPDDAALLMTCREEPLSRLTRIVRFSTYRRTTPFDLRVRNTDGTPVVRLARGVPILSSHVRIYDGDDVLIGTLRQRPFSIRGVFDVLDATGRPICRLQARGVRTEFALLTPERVELARITKRWAGLSKELFTSADHYLLQIADIVPPDLLLRQLILAAAIGIGLIVKFELP